VAASDCERVEAFERAGDRAGSGPVGGQMQCGLAGVAGELSGDVQDAVAQALGFGELVLAVERELLGPDGDVVREPRELKPRRVGVEGVKRQVSRAGCFQALDAVFDLGVLAMVGFQRRDVLAVLSVMKHWKR
jgi:hypothetical protein